MQKYKKAALSIAFLSFLISGGMTTGYSQDDTSGEDSKVKFNQEESILQSFENNDYEYWRKIVPKKSKIANILKKEAFQEFITIRELARNGNYDQAIELAEKLEINLKVGLLDA